MRIVVGCAILIVLIAVGTVHRIDSPPTPRPHRPQHPASIYYPPGVPQPTVPGDPGWRTSK